MKLSSAPFSGSYSAEDVQFLLKPIAIEDTPLHIKEALIQSGQKHYSEMLSHESLPSEDYVRLFDQALELNGQRMAGHLLHLAERIKATRPHGIALISLARAGTPIGVLLKHVLKRYFGIEAPHYSISIIRDYGIDRNALRHILQKHAPRELTFIDGWTGKGVIARQLAESLRHFAAENGVDIPAELYVLADLSGDAAVAASSEDYLIPSCLLNATVSGLISRTVLNRNPAHSGDFHGCYFYHEFRQHDFSNSFIAKMLRCVEQYRQDPKKNQRLRPVPAPEQLKIQSRQWIEWISRRYGVRNPHYIKPGIGEATRVLLRREAGLLLLNDLHSESTRHLHWLATSKNVPIAVVGDLPYRAAALIKEVNLPA
ncbi:MAG: cysteine protease StiP family protein [Methylosarcina sp.]